MGLSSRLDVLSCLKISGESQTKVNKIGRIFVCICCDKTGERGEVGGGGGGVGSSSERP